jgi:hypothetical protein
MNDTTESIGPLPVGYVEPAEQILSDDEREPVQAFNIGDLVRITNGTATGQFGKVSIVHRSGRLGVRLIFDTRYPLLYNPRELKLIRSHEKPGWRPLHEDLYRPRVYKDKSDGKWITEDDIRLYPRFRSEHDGRPVHFREHTSFAAALTTVREQAALDQAKRDAVEISAKGIVA